MSVNRVFYDTQTGFVLGVHDVAQTVSADAYAAEGRTVKAILADASEIPNPVEDEYGEDGRVIGGSPRKLTKTWLKNHEEPLLPQVDGTKGKLALLDANKLDAVEAAIKDLPAKEARKAQLTFDAPTWSRSDPILAQIGVDDAVWRDAQSR